MFSPLPPVTEILATAQVVSLPLVESFRGIKQRKVLLFEGPSGWAEFAPFENHDLAHSAKWLEAAIEQAYGSWPTASRESVAVNAILPEVDLVATEKLATKWIADFGFSTFKFKTSADVGADIAKAQLISERVADAGFIPQIRVDANGLWDLDVAAQNLNRLAAEVPALEYVEQPIENLTDYLVLKKQSATPIALDESLRLIHSPDFDLIHQVADVVVLKAIPLGGLKNALHVASQIELPIVVSGSLDSSVGLAAGLQLASLVGDKPAGLATDLLFADYVTSHKHKIASGRIEVGRRIPDLSSQHLADADVVAQLRTRLIECYKYLEQL
jgi:o-succinylbenzoate synthase